jgi:type II secretory pathway pseudopilin PulG
MSCVIGGIIMPFCPNCGKQLPEGSKFCDVCGAKVEKTAPDAGPSPASDAAAAGPQAKGADAEKTASPSPARKPPRGKVPMVLVVVLVVLAVVSLVLAIYVTFTPSRQGQAPEQSQTQEQPATTEAQTTEFGMTADQVAAMSTTQVSGTVQEYQGKTYTCLDVSSSDGMTALPVSADSFIIVGDKIVYTPKSSPDVATPSRLPVIDSIPFRGIHMANLDGSDDRTLCEDAAFEAYAVRSSVTYEPCLFCVVGGRLYYTSSSQYVAGGTQQTGAADISATDDIGTAYNKVTQAALELAEKIQVKSVDLSSGAVASLVEGSRLLGVGTSEVVYATNSPEYDCGTDSDDYYSDKDLSAWSCSLDLTSPTDITSTVYPRETSGVIISSTVRCAGDRLLVSRADGSQGGSTSIYTMDGGTPTLQEKVTGYGELLTLDGSSDFVIAGPYGNSYVYDMEGSAVGSFANSVGGRPVALTSGGVVCSEAASLTGANGAMVRMDGSSFGLTLVSYQGTLQGDLADVQGASPATNTGAGIRL